MRYLERQILLQIIDNRWREHLYEMDYLREGIHLRGFAQIDPLVAYKNEGFKMFQRAHELDLGGVRPGHLPRRGQHRAGQTSSRSRRGRAAQERAVLGRRCRAALRSGEAAEAATAGRHRAPAPRARPPSAAGDGSAATAAAGENPATVVKSDREKIGRNDPCWCGSGKKYKKCHGA